MARFSLFILAMLVLSSTQALAQNPTRADMERYRAQVNQVRPGLGNDKGLPQGSPFKFPPGVSLAGPIAGVGEDEACGDGEHGSGVYVSVCISICNASGGRVRVEIPRGLMIVSKSTGPFQNGLLLERVAIDVPPTRCNGAGIPLDAKEDEVEQVVAPTEGAFQVKLNLYCLNDSKMPSESGTPYALGPITSDPDLTALLARIEGKVLDEEAMDVVQTAIYSITEGRGLGWNDERALDDL